jgi:sensor histidine kinase YesM
MPRDRALHLHVLLNFKTWIHLTGWAAFIASPFLFPLPFLKPLPAPAFQYLVYSRIGIDLLLMGIFYFNLFRLTPRLITHNNTLIFILVLFGFLTLIIVIDSVSFLFLKKHLQGYFLEVSRIDPISKVLANTRFLSPPQLITNIIVFALIILVSSLVAVLDDRLRQKTYSQDIIYEKVKSELAILKLQISPHFLFNTLNNIRWLTRTKSDQAEKSIIELSDILRYMLYQAVHEQVYLQEEINYLRKYISLQKLRISPHVKIDFFHEDFSNYIKIEPLLLLPFIENAFKFGIHSETHSEITIAVHLIDNELIFFCINPRFPPTPDEFSNGSGLGLQNVKRRLDLYYPDTHSLLIESTPSQFIVNLRIRLAND